MLMPRFCGCHRHPAPMSEKPAGHFCHERTKAPDGMPHRCDRDRGHAAPHRCSCKYEWAETTATRSPKPGK